MGGGASGGPRSQQALRAKHVDSALGRLAAKKAAGAVGLAELGTVGALAREDVNAVTQVDPRCWMFEVKKDYWTAFDSEINHGLTLAWDSGEASFLYDIGDDTYEVCFESNVQTHWRTGDETRVYMLVPPGYVVPERGDAVREAAARAEDVSAELHMQETCLPEINAPSSDLPSASSWCYRRSESYRRVESRGSLSPKATVRNPSQTRLSYHAIRGAGVRDPSRKMSEPNLFSVGEAPSSSSSFYGPNVPFGREASRSGTLPIRGQAPHGVMLPAGVTWPQQVEARRAAEALMEQLSRTPTSDRGKLVRAARLRWHPDKNPNNQSVATEMFLFVQALKEVNPN